MVVPYLQYKVELGNVNVIFLSPLFSFRGRFGRLKSIIHAGWGYWAKPGVSFFVFVQRLESCAQDRGHWMNFKVYYYLGFRIFISERIYLFTWR